MKRGLKLKTQNQKAFTTIELLVAMSLFIILISLAAGGLVNALRTQRSIVSLIEANNNVSLALEQIAREMRTGNNFQKISGSEVKFVNAQGVSVRYRSNGGAIERGTETNLDVNYQKITAQTIKITNFNITLLDLSQASGYPPRITVSVGVSPASKYIEGVVVNIQTTVSGRNI